jgi:hypothetical protein
MAYQLRPGGPSETEEFLRNKKICVPSIQISLFCEAIFLFMVSPGLNFLAINLKSQMLSISKISDSRLTN